MRRYWAFCADWFSSWTVGSFSEISQQQTFCTDGEERGRKRVKGSGNVKRLIFKKRKEKSTFISRFPRRFNRKTEVCRLFIFYFVVVLHPIGSHGASHEDVCGDEQFDFHKLSLLYDDCFTCKRIRWTCTAHPAATISCCNSWNADFFLFFLLNIKWVNF